MSNATVEITAEIQAQLVKFAQADLNSARRNGSILVTQTKQGLLGLAHADGIYTLTTQGINPTVLASGKAGVVKAALADLYTVA